MILPLPVRSLLFAVAAGSLWLASAASFQTESAGAPPSDDIPEAVAALLGEDGVRVTDGSGNTVVEVWGRTAAFDGEGTAGFGVRYDFIPEGALIGIARFPEGSDFREQDIPAGVYTLRFGLHPEDGNHMGVAPSRDFVLVSPAAKDTDATKNYSFDELVNLSYETGNSHPTILRVELPDSDEIPNLWENDYEHWILDFPVVDDAMGLVIYGHADE